MSEISEEIAALEEALRSVTAEWEGVHRRLLMLYQLHPDTRSATVHSLARWGQAQTAIRNAIKRLKRLSQ